MSRTARSSRTRSSRRRPRRLPQLAAALPPLLLLAALILPAAAALAADPGADAVLGLWATEDEKAHVEVTQEGGEYAGKIVWLKEPIYPPDDEQGMAGQEKVDRENPDPKLQKRPIIGLQIVHGFTYAGDGLWKGGQIYDPDNGKTYKSKMTLQEDGTLFVRGFIGFSLLGRTTVWTRVE